MFLNIFVSNVALRWWLAYSVIPEGRCHWNSFPLSITLNLLLAVGAPDSEYETLMESLFETFDEEVNFHFLFCPERFLVLFSFQFPQIRGLRMYSVSFPWLFLLFKHFLLWRKFSIFSFGYDLLRWLFRWVSSFYHSLSALSHCMSSLPGE